MGFNIDDVLEVLQIVKECKDAELHIDTGDIKLSIVKGEVGNTSGSMPDSFGAVCLRKQSEPEAASPAAVAEANNEPKPVAALPVEAMDESMVEEGLVPIKANVTSVFYRRPSPNESPFVEVGDEVQEDTVLCLLEVMKCFRQVTAGMKGCIERICVESNSIVEQGTILFLIRPK